MKTIVLIDDHPVVALGLDLALRKHDDFKTVKVIGDPSIGTEELAYLNPDALILDLVFEGALHLSLVRDCRLALPNAAIVVFSSLPPNPYARRAIDAGADDFISKSVDMSMLLACLGRLLPYRAGIQAAPSSAQTRAEHDRQVVFGDVRFTSREREIAWRLGRGLSVAMIADEIGISANTVAVHRDNLRKKMGCRDTKDLVACLARMDGGVSVQP